jgi:uncharacterized protein
VAPIADIVRNVPFLAAILGVLFAQSLKPVFHKLLRGTWNFSSLVGTGGMPSSHSAAVMALATAVGMRNGFDSTLFAISMMLGLIVMYDAAGIRRHAGEQAMAINQLKAEFEKHLRPGSSQWFHERRRKRLNEMLGHQPIEVLAGAITGIVIGLAVSLYVNI